MWKSVEKFLPILVGAVVQMIPLGYFMMTEGQRSLYQPVVFFPHTFISLLLSIGAAVINALINQRWIKEKFFYVPITVLGGVLLMLYSVYGILAADSKGFYLLFPILLTMLLTMIYEVLQGILHAIAGRIFS